MAKIQNVDGFERNSGIHFITRYLVLKLLILNLILKAKNSKWWIQNRNFFLVQRK